MIQTKGTTTDSSASEISPVSKVFGYGFYLIILLSCSLVSMVKFWTEVIVKEGNLNWCGS